MKTGRLLVLVFVLFPALAGAESLNIGVPSFGSALNLVDSPHPAAAIVRALTTRALTELKTAENREDLGFALGLADAMVVAPDRMRWSFRVRPHTHFSNDARVTGDDVRYALQHCPDPDFRGVAGEITLRAQDEAYSSDEEWVDIKLREGARQGGPLQRDDLPLLLARCPIFHAASARIFERDFGYGTNFVSAGPFRLSAYRARRSIILTRWTSYGAARAFEIKAFDQDDGGLASLRVGSIDLLFLSPQGPALEAARKDETLSVAHCPMYSVVHRKGLNFSCEEGLRLSELEYVS